MLKQTIIISIFCMHMLKYSAKECAIKFILMILNNNVIT